MKSLGLGWDDSSYVLPNQGTGKPYVCLHGSYTTACKKARISGLRFHDLRHTFATRLVQGGVDILAQKRGDL